MSEAPWAVATAATLALAGCQHGQDEVAQDTHDEAIERYAQDSLPVDHASQERAPVPPTEPPTEPPGCGARRDLVLGPHQSCSEDQDCVLHLLGEHCYPLACYEAFNVHTDFAALDREVDELARNFAPCCQGTVSCAGPPDLKAVCDLPRGRCKWARSDL